MTWTPDQIPSFDRGGLTVTSHDPRNRDYPTRALMGAVRETQHRRRDRRWRRWRPVFDQVRGTCVPQTWVGMAATTPVLGRTPRPMRRALNTDLPYVWMPLMQRVDEWPGEYPTYDGTSTLAGAKITVAQGYGDEYRWNFSLDDTIDALVNVGPVATGLNWKMDAAYALPDGRPDPARGTGTLGGHETYLTGYDHDAGEVEGWNSWGPGFGDGGRFRWKLDYLEERLEDRGDSCVLIA